MARAARRPRFSLEVLRPAWRFAAGMFALSLVALVQTQADKVLLIKLLPLRAYGYYGLGVQVAAALLLGVAPLFTALFPRFTQLVAEQDEDALASAYHRGCQLMAVVILPAAAVIAFFSRELLFAWTGNATTAAQAAPITTLLVAAAACTAMLNLPYALQLAYGWTRLAIVQNVAATFVTIPGLYLLARRAGAVGAAVLPVVLGVVYIVVFVPVIHRRLLRREMWRWYVADLLLPGAAACAVAGAARVVMPSLASRPALLGCLAVTWLAAVTATGAAAPEVRAVVRVGVAAFGASARHARETDAHRPRP
jgi:O-antigen/teichoic acid export membrane protein